MKSSNVAVAAALMGVAACMGNVPSGPASMNAGVGFGDYQNYLRERESVSRSGVPFSVPPEQTRAQVMPLAQQPRVAPAPQAFAQVPIQPAPAVAAMAPVPAPAPMQMTALSPPVSAPTTQPWQPAAGAPMAAPMRSAPMPAAPFAPPIAAPLQTAGIAAPTPGMPAPGMPAPGVTVSSFGTTPAFDPGGPVRPTISNEQDFAAVSARETIESDRERLAQQRAQYQTIHVDSVPDGSVSGGPNLMDYALSTRHSVGTSIYTRINPLRWAQWENACLQFRNQEAAQSAFLASGGPGRDPGNLDPDGDGYACWWDPAPYRAAALAATR